MSPERATAERLNELLDAVADGDVTRSRGLDPATAATVERFFAADDAPGPPAGLAERLWQELSARAVIAETVSYVPAALPARNGHVPPPPLQIAPPRGGSSALAYFATAALIALTLIGGVLVSRGAFHLVRPDQQGVIIPAAENTPELPVTGSLDTLLLQAMVEQMPPGRSHRLSLNRIRLAPGAVQAVGNEADTGTGLYAFTVESGRVTVEADAPVQLTRAETSLKVAPSLVAPGTAIDLDVGDRLYAPSDVSFRRRNDGSSPATLLELSIGTVRDPIDVASGVTYDHGFPYAFPPVLPPVPTEATIQRLTLRPGAELAVRDLPGLELVYVEAGTLDLVYAKAEAPETPVRVFTIHAGSGTDTFGRTPERAVLANRGADPLVILAASLVPANAGEATPPPVWSDGWGSGDHAEE